MRDATACCRVSGFHQVRGEEVQLGLAPSPACHKRLRCGAAAPHLIAPLLLGERPTALALTGIALALPAIVDVSPDCAARCPESRAARDRRPSTLIPVTTGPVTTGPSELRPDLAAAGEALVRAGLFERAERELRRSDVAADLLAVV